MIAIKTNRIPTIAVGFILTVGAVAVSFPFVWMLLGSIKHEREIFQLPLVFLPLMPTLDNFYRIFSTLDFGIYLRNTLVITALSYIGFFLNAIAGFAFAKYQFRHKETLFFIILATMMIPGQITMIPNFLIINQLGLINTMAGIVLPGLASGFSIFLFRQFMSSVPDELLDSARVDGAKEFRIFLQIVCPVAKPVLAVQATLTFIGGWNSFLWPLVIARSHRLYTLSAGLALLRGEHGNDYALQMASASLMVVPIVIVFVFLQRYIMDGFVLSGIK